MVVDNKTEANIKSKIKNLNKSSSSKSTTVIPPLSYHDALLSSSPVTFKANSNASGHYVREDDKKVLHSIISTNTVPIVQLPDSTHIQQATHQGILPLPVPATAHVLLQLSSSSLLSGPLELFVIRIV